MADHHRRADKKLVQQVLLDDPEFLRRIVERALQQVLEAKITEHVGAAPYERTESRNERDTATTANEEAQNQGWPPRVSRAPGPGGRVLNPTSSPATNATRRS